ncbi:hypothetical protein ACI394_29090, partial [Klebsiella pneumoniae]|uniref:hypothetical protein n=1 Tax=Klebsiella pneumoniae TaxID=573 RepID=UPI0038522F5F
SSVVWSISKTPEIPPTDEELAALRASKKGILQPFIEIIHAISDMPKVMWQLALVYYFNGMPSFVIGRMHLKASPYPFGKHLLRPIK